MTLHNPIQTTTVEQLVWKISCRAFEVVATVKIAVGTDNATIIDTVPPMPEWHGKKLTELKRYARKYHGYSQQLEAAINPRGQRYRINSTNWNQRTRRRLYSRRRSVDRD